MVIVPLPPLGWVKATLILFTFDTDSVILIVGALGIVVTVDDSTDGSDVPLVFVADTVNVYTVFGVNPDTVIGEVEPVPIKPPGLLVTV